MTLLTQTIGLVPEETARVARAADPKGNIYLQLRDTLGTLYQDQSFAHLFPQNGRPVEAPWRLALITIMQFMEELQIVKPRMPCEGALIGNTCLG